MNDANTCPECGEEILLQHEEYVCPDCQERFHEHCGCISPDQRDILRCFSCQDLHCHRFCSYEGWQSLDEEGKIVHSLYALRTLVSHLYSLPKETFAPVIAAIQEADTCIVTFLQSHYGGYDEWN